MNYRITDHLVINVTSNIAVLVLLSVASTWAKCSHLFLYLFYNMRWKFSYIVQSTKSHETFLSQFKDKNARKNNLQFLILH